MTIDTKDFLNSILDSIARIDYIKPDTLPNIDLYMDQVTTFMDSQLVSAKRHEEDKVLTKTMINNYAKNNLLPPPDRKKYSKEHVLTLIFIYYFKNIVSINDLQSILNPITEKYFDKDSTLGLIDIYSEVFSLEESEVEHISKDIARKFNISFDTFSDAPEDEQEFLHTFSFICMLSFDVFVKKMLIEKIIDGLPKENPKEKKQKSKEPKDKEPKDKEPTKDNEPAKDIKGNETSDKETKGKDLKENEPTDKTTKSRDLKEPESSEKATKDKISKKPESSETKES